MRKLKNKAIGIEKRKKAITGKTPVPADHEDPKSPNWKVTSGGNEKVLRCSNTRKHARPKWLSKHYNRQHPRASWVAERPYCSQCYKSFGAIGREAMCEDREKDVRSHRLKPEPNRAYTAEEGRTDAKTQLSVAMKYGCHHRELYDSQSTRKVCLCLQMYRVDGTALIDELWAHRTRKMREDWETLPESSTVFRWHHCPCLERVEVLPDCLREVVFNIWGEYGRCGNTSVEDDTCAARLGHICSVETAQKIHADGIIKAQVSTHPLEHGRARAGPACYFFYCKDFVSILKGMNSLWKHVKKEKPQVRWGFFVQKEDANLADHGIQVKSRYGAKWVYASERDVPVGLFNFHVAPPTLPYAAFRVSHFWGPPAMQWAALSNYLSLMGKITKEQGDHEYSYEEGHFYPRQVGQANYKAVVPMFNKNGEVTIRRAISDADVAKRSKTIYKAWKDIQELGGQYGEIQTSVSLTDGLLKLSEDTHALLGWKSQQQLSRDGHVIGWETTETEEAARALTGMAEPNDDDGGHGDDGGENGDDVADDSEHDNDGANELAKMAMLAANIPTTGMMKRVKLADRRTCGIDAPLKLTCVSVSRFFSCFTFSFPF